jgi:hypothetical protein
VLSICICGSSIGISLLVLILIPADIYFTIRTRLGKNSLFGNLFLDKQSGAYAENALIQTPDLAFSGV